MKTRNKIKLILMILICILVILIGFVGVYARTGNKYANKLPNYTLAPDLKGTDVLELEVDNSTNTVYYDSEGKKIDSSEVTDENKSQYTAVEEKVNLDENLNAENYKKTLKILEEKLKFLKVDQYNIDLDEKTGKVVLAFEDEYKEDVESILPMEAKLELIDSNTTDLILDSSNIKSSEATYASTEDGYSIYLTLQLNKVGIDKINSIEKYKTKTDDNGEVTTNKFKIQFDADEVEEVSYDDMILTGKTLRITLQSKVTSSSTVNSKLNTATIVSKLTNIGRAPVVYKISAEEYIKSDVSINTIYTVLAIILLVVCVISIILIIKYRSKGLLATIATFAIIAIITIVIRYVKIPVSLNSFAGIIALVFINTCLVINTLKNLENKENTFGDIVKQTYLKSIDVLIISLIIFAVFAFSQMTVINSMGLLLFWGWLSVVLGNLLITIPMLYIKDREVRK